MARIGVGIRVGTIALHHALNEVGPAFEPCKLRVRRRVPVMLTVTGGGARPEDNRAGAGGPVSVVAPHHGVRIFV